MKNILLLLYSLLLLLPATAQYDFSGVKALIQDQLTNNQVPSVSIAVVRKGKIIWEESFGWADKEKHIAATVHTPYALASVTKTFTATAILQLADRHLLRLDSPVNDYLGQAKISSELWSPAAATVQHVLMHTAGLTSYDQACVSTSCSADTAIRRYGFLCWQPGTYFDYSNVGYGILGEVVAKVSGRSFATFLQQELFTPLGMRHSFTGIPPRGVSYAVSYSGAPGAAAVPPKLSPAPGASSCYSSVHDLARFAMLHLQVPGITSREILSADAIHTMQHPSPDTPAAYSLSWSVKADNNGYRSFAAQGGTVEAQTLLQLIPSEGLAVIILSNTGRTNCGAIANETFAALLPGFRQAMMNKKVVTPPPFTPAAMPAFAQGKWQGFIRTHRGNLLFTLELTDSGKALVRLDTAAALPVAVRYNRGRYQFKMPGNLHLPDDTGHSPYTLNFTLQAQGESLLYGAVVTYPTIDPQTPLLPFWVRLTKKGGSPSRGGSPF